MAKRVDIEYGLPGQRSAPRVQKFFEKPSKTRQSETASTDLSKLVQKYRAIGALPPSTAQYGDTTVLPTSRLEAYERIRAGVEAFQALPLKVRQALEHDPRRFEDWIRANPEAARSYGLLAQDDPPSPPENPTSSGGAGEGKKEDAFKKASDEGKA